jgi:hypothetical protein
MGFSVRFIVFAALVVGLSSCIIPPPPMLVPPPPAPSLPENLALPPATLVPPPPPEPDQPTMMNPPVFPPTPSNIDLCAPGYHWDVGHRDSEGVLIRPHCAPNQPPNTPPPR